jgi:hypothetical protein
MLALFLALFIGWGFPVRATGFPNDKDTSIVQNRTYIAFYSVGDRDADMLSISRDAPSSDPKTLCGTLGYLNQKSTAERSNIATSFNNCSARARNQGPSVLEPEKSANV